MIADFVRDVAGRVHGERAGASGGSEEWGEWGSCWSGEDFADDSACGWACE